MIVACLVYPFCALALCLSLFAHLAHLHSAPKIVLSVILVCFVWLSSLLVAAIMKYLLFFLFILYFLCLCFAREYTCCCNWEESGNLFCAFWAHLSSTHMHKRAHTHKTTHFLYNTYLHFFGLLYFVVHTLLYCLLLLLPLLLLPFCASYTHVRRARGEHRTLEIYHSHGHPCHYVRRYLTGPRSHPFTVFTVHASNPTLQGSRCIFASPCIVLLRLPR